MIATRDFLVYTISAYKAEIEAERAKPNPREEYIILLQSSLAELEEELAAM